jgi:hypothetical protein
LLYILHYSGRHFRGLEPGLIGAHGSGPGIAARRGGCQERGGQRP